MTLKQNYSIEDGLLKTDFKIKVVSLHADEASWVANESALNMSCQRKGAAMWLDFREWLLHRRSENFIHIASEDTSV